MENKILFTKVVVLGMVGELFFSDPVSTLMNFCAIIFYCTGTFVLLSSYLERNRKWKQWAKNGFKPEDKDKYGIE